MPPVTPIKNYTAVLPKITFVFTCIVIAAGCVVLAGWQFTIEALKHPSAKFITVNPVTALNFILLGISLILFFYNGKHKGLHAYSRAAIIAVFLACLCRLIQWLGLITWRIDFLLFSSQLSDSNSMAITTAIAFMGSCLSIWLLHYPQGRALLLSNIIACIVFGFGFFSLLGYYYRVPEFFNKIHFTPMAVYTAACFMLLSLAILFYKPKAGIIKHFFSPLTGGQAGRILLPLAVIVPVVLGVSLLYTYHTSLYSTELGITVLVTAVVVVFSIIIACSAYLLNNKDTIRRRADERFRILLEFAPDAMIVADKDGLIKMANARTEKMFGYTRKEIIEQPVTMLIPRVPSANNDGDTDGYIDTLIKILEGNGIELTGIKKNGTGFSVETTISPLMGNKEAVVYYAIRDISERKVIEEKLRQSEEIYRSLVTSAKDYAIFMLDVNGNVLTWNKGAEAIKGYTDNEIKGKNMAVFYTQQDIESDMPAKILQNAAAYGAYEVEGQRVRKDGSVFWADVVVTALYDDKGQLRGFSKVVKDITEQRKAQETLEAFNDELARQVNEKTEMLEESNSQLRQLSAYLQTTREQERKRIAREIHDNLGQMLTGLRMDFVWLKKKMPPADDAINTRLEKTLELLNDVRKEARRLAANLHPTALEDLGLTTALQSLANGFESRSGVKTNFTADTGGINDLTISTELAIGVYRVLQEALNNILKHAQASNIDAYLTITNDKICLKVTDNGLGFTVGERADKSSLGLVSMRERALMMNGSLTIDSAPGKGTTIHLTLPLILK